VRPTSPTSSSASGSSSIRNNEGALIDNVALSGVTLERGSVQSVPEPGTLALAGLSLVLLSTTAPRSRRLGRSNWGGR